MVTPFLRKGPGSHRDFPWDFITPFVSLRRDGVTPSTSKGGVPFLSEASHYDSPSCGKVHQSGLR